METVKAHIRALDRREQWALREWLNSHVSADFAVAPPPKPPPPPTFRGPELGEGRNPQVNLLVRALFRYGRMDYLDGFFLLRDTSADHVFKEPFGALRGRKLVNFALTFRCLFTRKLAISVLREEQWPLGWPATLRLPWFDVERSSAEYHAHAPLLVRQQAEAAAFSLRADARALDRSEHLRAARELARLGADSFGRKVLRPAGLKEGELEALYTSDRRNLDTLAQIAFFLRKGDIPGWLRQGEVARTLQPVCRDLGIAAENLRALRGYYEETFTPQKAEKHFPLATVRARTAFWDALRTLFAETVERLSGDEEAKAGRLCDALNRFRTSFKLGAKDRTELNAFCRLYTQRLETLVPDRLGEPGTLVLDEAFTEWVAQKLWIFLGTEWNKPLIPADLKDMQARFNRQVREAFVDEVLSIGSTSRPNKR
ncbi:MAG: hypothetical protein JJT96_11550 [Opitutales bacterium]|nr:hypothetical protein [Opitutales bacterium]